MQFKGRSILSVPEYFSNIDLLVLQTMQMEELGDEILFYIFQFLAPIDLCKASLVSKYWNSITCDEKLWEMLCVREWQWMFNILEEKQMLESSGYHGTWKELWKLFSTSYTQKEHWFSQLDRTRAEMLLKRKGTIGDYIVRPSSYSGCVVISYVDYNWEINHELVYTMGKHGGVFSAVDSRYLVFNTLSSLLLHYRKIFRKAVPPPNATTPMYPPIDTVWKSLGISLEKDVQLSTNTLRYLNDKCVLHKACRNKSEELVNRMLEVGLRFRIDKAKDEILEFFSDDSVNALDSKGRTALHHLVSRSKNPNRSESVNALNIAGKLLSYGIDIDAHNCGYTPLHTLLLHISNNSTNLEERSLLKFLLDSGADVTLEDSMHGNNALHMAVMTRNEAIVEIIANHSERNKIINTKQGSFPGNTPLHLACELSECGIMELLINAGAKVDSENDLKQTPMHCAVCKPQDWFGLSKFKKPHHSSKYYSHQLISGLKRMGADVNHCDISLTTPLHLSAQNGHYQSTASLIRGGATVNAKDCNGRTPLLLVGAQLNSSHIEREVTSLQYKISCGYMGLSIAQLIDTISKHYCSITDVLLKNGADAMAMDADGSTCDKYKTEFDERYAAYT